MTQAANAEYGVLQVSFEGDHHVSSCEFSAQPLPWLAQILAITAIAILSGCAIRVPQQTFDKTANANLSHIALERVEEPEKFHVLSAGGTGFVFGLVGAFAEAQRSKALTADFTTRMRELKLGPRMDEALKSELEQRGFKVTYLVDYRPVGAGKEANYSNRKTDADAILVVSWRFVGYRKDTFEPSLTPYIFTHAKLISPSSGSKFYDQQFLYTPEEPGRVKGAKYLTAVGSPSYESFDLLMESAPEAANAIIAGVRPIAQAIASDLR